MRRSNAAYPATLLWTFFVVLCLGCASQSAWTRNVKLERAEQDAPTYHRVINLGTKAAQAMDAPSAGFRYGILDADVMNAMVDTKNKNIYVTKGLMSRLNDRELLCVFAHEWAHVTKGHYAERLQKEETIDTISTIVAMATPVGMIASFIINPVAKKSFTRAQEEEADDEAAKTLNERMKISPYACISAFGKLRAYVEKTGGSEQGGLLDSHPSITARIERLREMWPDKPRAYYLSQITVRSAAEAQAVIKRHGAGEAFSALAAAYSTDPLVAFNNGELGWFEEWELNPEVAEAIKKRKGNELIVFRSSAGFQVVKAIELKQSQLRTADKRVARGKIQYPALNKINCLTLRHYVAARFHPELCLACII